MPEIKELFGEYIRMRANGLDTQNSLRTLRHYILPLPQHRREELARLLRAWESNLIETPEDTLQDENESSEASELWIECPSCERRNRLKDVFCHACGRMLHPLSDGVTRTFAPATEELFHLEYFGADSILILTTGDQRHTFTIRPQEHPIELTIGRRSETQVVQPTVDLTDADAGAFGVSRLHLAMAYDKDNQVIKIYDLGSANGTTVNAQKILPTENRILRSGDELRLVASA